MVAYSLTTFVNIIKECVVKSNAKLQTTHEFRFETFANEADVVQKIKQISGVPFPLVFMPTPITINISEYDTFIAEVDFYILETSKVDEFAPDRQKNIYAQKLEPYCTRFVKEIGYHPSVFFANQISITNLYYAENNLNEIVDAIHLKLKIEYFNKKITCI